jgi:hypothetical protein
MTCPTCSFENPPSAGVCDYGHIFDAEGEWIFKGRTAGQPATAMNGFPSAVPDHVRQQTELLRQMARLTKDIRLIAPWLLISDLRAIRLTWIATMESR